MAKQCPPGVICIENMTLCSIIVIVFVGTYLYFRNKTPFNPPNITIKNIPAASPIRNIGLFSEPSYSFSNMPNDVLMNPYVPPLRDSRNIPSFGNSPQGGIPINVPTQSVNSDYRQIGILTRINGPETILSLMGRPLFANRDKWQFYTLSDKNNSVKLPVSNKGKSCTNEYGCDNIYNGDTVYVEGYNDAFKATVYDNATMQYIPYI